MEKKISYAIITGSAVTIISGAISAFNAFKGKKWMGFSLGVLTIGVSVAAFKYSLDAIKSDVSSPKKSSIPELSDGDIINNHINEIMDNYNKYSPEEADAELKSLGLPQNELSLFKKLATIRKQRLLNVDEQKKAASLYKYFWVVESSKIKNN
jgi:hypothetical protein